MASILPFRGIYFNFKKANNLKKVTCPPYDVISPQEQDRFYRLHPYNVIRLILGKESPKDNGKDNRNIRAAHFFKTWVSKEILKQEFSPAIYVYRLTYPYGNRQHTSLGFIALSRLEDWQRKKVLPHEDTFAKFKTDRLNLLRATKANFESILSLYPSSAKIEKILKKAVKSRPMMKFKDEQNIEHTVYSLSDPRDIAVIKKEMAKKILFIADGHHRYQAALNFSRELSRSKPLSNGQMSNYMMMTFMDMSKSNLTILPTHRVVYNLPGFSHKKLFDNLALYFTIEKVSARALSLRLKERKNKNVTFGLCLKGGQYFILTLKPKLNINKLVREEKSLAWKKLDVSILQKLILERLDGFNPDKNLFYTRSAEEALRKVKDGSAQMAFLLNPTTIEDIKAVASRGEKMPHKSTYFFPKLRSGLIMRKIEN